MTNWNSMFNPLTISILLLGVMLTGASTMEKRLISTTMGDIAVFSRVEEGTTPVVFLHGVYFDHQLWDYFTEKITDRTVVVIDMPLHGESKSNIPEKWDLSMCGRMLIDILDTLEITKAYAVGHSWGSMTILRAAYDNPGRFHHLVLCNTPLDKGEFGTRIKFFFQHMLLPFKDFYMGKAAEAIFSPKTINEEMITYLKSKMSRLSGAEIKEIDKRVILKADDGWQYANALQIPVLSIAGEDDYVPMYPTQNHKLIKGGHVSPLEAPEEVMEGIQSILGI